MAVFAVVVAVALFAVVVEVFCPSDTVSDSATGTMDAKKATQRMRANFIAAL